MMAQHRGSQLRPGPLVVAMKGHPGTGKTTIARAIASALRCPLLDKDDIRDCTLPLQQTLASSATAAAGTLNELSYSVLWRIAETQLRSVGLDAVVIDSPLSRRVHLDQLLRVAGQVGGRVVVVECQPGEEAEWRRRLEARAAGGAGEDGGGWHKPATWEDLRRLVSGYGGSSEYEMGGVPKIVVDTTGGGEEGGSDMRGVLDFVNSHLHNRNE